MELGSCGEVASAVVVEGVCDGGGERVVAGVVPSFSSCESIGAGGGGGEVVREGIKEEERGGKGEGEGGRSLGGAVRSVGTPSGVRRCDEAGVEWPRVL